MPRPIRQFPAPSQTDVESLAGLWDRPSATGRESYDVLLATGRLRRRIAATTITTSLARVGQTGDIPCRRR
jgi:hypothetical protein